MKVVGNIFLNYDSFFFFQKTFFRTNFSNFLLQTLLILVFIAGVALGFHPDAFPLTRALLRSVIRGGKKSEAPRAARRYSGFSRT